MMYRSTATLTFKGKTAKEVEKLIKAVANSLPKGCEIVSGKVHNVKRLKLLYLQGWLEARLGRDPSSDEDGYVTGFNAGQEARSRPRMGLLVEFVVEREKNEKDLTSVLKKLKKLPKD